MPTDKKFKEIDRSTGRNFLSGSIWAIVLAVTLLIVALKIEVRSFDDANSTTVLARAWCMTLSGYAATAAVLLFLVGCIIRAIWFLPGDEVKRITKVLSNGNP